MVLLEISSGSRPRMGHLKWIVTLNLLRGDAPGQGLQCSLIPRKIPALKIKDKQSVEIKPRHAAVCGGLVVIASPAVKLLLLS